MLYEGLPTQKTGEKSLQSGASRFAKSLLLRFDVLRSFIPVSCVRKKTRHEGEEFETENDEPVLRSFGELREESV